MTSGGIGGAGISPPTDGDCRNCRCSGSGGGEPTFFASVQQIDVNPGPLYNSPLVASPVDAFASILANGPVQILVPSFTVDMMMTVHARVPAPQIDRDGYTGPMALFEWLDLNATNYPWGGIATLKRSIHDDKPGAIPGAAPYAAPDYSEYVWGDGFDVSRSYVLLAGFPDTINVDYSLNIHDDGTDGTYPIAPVDALLEVAVMGISVTL